MRDDDYYKKIGFKCGLEIHQRLATSKKLFCSCSTSASESQIMDSVIRKQRAIAGELGSIDRSTSFESSRGRTFMYKIFKDTTCLVDIDEEPPHNVNKDAIEASLRLAIAFGAEIPDEIEPMRKGVVDGSDPSAFQRTMMVAHSGTVEVNGKKFNIISMFLEEESSGIESNGEDLVVYNVDRLGIPLIEIDTDPSISSPHEAREVALKIGAIIRLTGKKNGDVIESEVQRGIGTIRQDVNVSIAGGTRVEIKGLQEIESVDTIIENEVVRQERLIEIKKELIAKSASVGKPHDLSRILRGSGAKMLTESISKGGIVLGVRLAGFAGLLGREINPDRRLGSEISDYARMSGVKGIIHSDEDLSRYGLDKQHEEKVRAALELQEDDAFILVTGPSEICSKAIEFARDRALMSMSEVPPETRAVLDSKNGTTRFMRPLPGGSRMYPETDAEPIEISNLDIDRIRNSTVSMEERLMQINKGLGNKQIAEQMAYSSKLFIYEYIINHLNGYNLVVATTLLEKSKELERSGINIKINKEVMLSIFKKYASGAITKAAIWEIMKHDPKSEIEVDDIIDSASLRRISGNELKDLVSKSGAAGKDAIRIIMSKHRMNVDGDELNSIISV